LLWFGKEKTSKKGARWKDGGFQKRTNAFWSNWPSLENENFGVNLKETMGHLGRESSKPTQNMLAKIRPGASS